ncbi:MAG: nuclear transport factor 2 family protein [Verrucomicrobiota bacterium]
MKHFSLLATLALIATTPLLSQCGQSPPDSTPNTQKPSATESTPPANPEEAIQNLVATYAQAYNSRDLETLFNLWTEDAVVTSQDGTTLNGREAITSALQKIVESSSAINLIINVDSIDTTKPGSASLKGSSFTSAAGASPVWATYSAEAQKGNNGWRISSFIDEGWSADPPPQSTPSDQMQPLAWLAGTWVDRATDSTITYYGAWAPGGNQLLRSFAEQSANGIQNAGHEIIEWDETKGAFSSHTFDASGAVTESEWTQDGQNTFIRKSTATLENGKKAAATQRIRKVDDNTYTMDIVEQSLDGEPLPDAIAITVTRVDSNE